ncbi:signal transduction histidine kinase [Yoonia maricola]|uniref:histidine kinase n=1 Tax=Yoonia maricola TaxID=420999 RepID=A0A2M8WPU7_9RHOB|nr:ATP-binding protein [Yoonia maricola]PJI92958.1 signal transduction histidine kinase [Yoonia maricola]
MSRRVTAKWRPPLALVLGGTLAAVFCLPLIGIGYFRVAGGVLGWAETSWMIGWMAFFATVILGALLWRLVLRPVRALTAYAENEGETAEPTHFGTPEFSQLGQAVLEMTSALRGREAVLRSYADHVTHELKSPLTVIQGAAELLENPDLSDADRSKLLQGITDNTRRMEALLDSQRALAQAQEVIPAGDCRLSDVLAGVEGAVVVTDGDIPLPREVMDLVVTHLAGNALAHGATVVSFDFQCVRLLISDNGSGISDGNRERIFDPFFTTRRAEGGTGMGLPIVRRMLQSQGADIQLLDGPTAVFEIRF